MKRIITLLAILPALILPVISSHLAAADNRPVMTIDGRNVTADEFRYLYRKNLDNGAEASTPRDYASLFALFKMKVYEAEAAGIDTTDAFRQELDIYYATIDPTDTLLRNEYRDGMLLFEISNRMVWERSTADSQGLQAHFEANRAKYAWESTRAKGWILFADRSDDMKQARAYLDGLNPLPDDIRPCLHERFGNSVVASLFIVKQGVNPMIDHLVFGTPLDEDMNLNIPWALAEAYNCRIIDAPEQWQDVKGAVTADYQQVLSDTWEAHLWQTHTVVYNYDVIDEMADL